MKVNQRAVLLLLNLVSTFNVNEGFTLLVTKSSSLPGDLLKLNAADYLSQLNQPFTIPEDVLKPAPAAPSYSEPVAAAPAAPSGADYLSQLNGAGPVVTPVSSIQASGSGDYLLQLNQSSEPISVQASGGDYLSQLAGSGSSAPSGSGQASGTSGYLLQLGSNISTSGSGAGPSCYLLNLEQQANGAGFTVPDFVELDECPVDGDYLSNLGQPANAQAPIVTPVSNVQASGSGDYLVQLNQQSEPIAVQASGGDYLSQLAGSGGAAPSGNGQVGGTAGYLVQLNSNASPSGSGTTGAGPCYLLSLNEQPNGAGFSTPQPVLVELEECDVVAQVTGDYLSNLNQPAVAAPSFAAPAAAAAAPAAPAPTSGDYLSNLNQSAAAAPSYAAPAASTPSYAAPAAAAPAAAATTGDYLSQL